MTDRNTQNAAPGSGGEAAGQPIGRITPVKVPASQARDGGQAVPALIAAEHDMGGQGPRFDEAAADAAAQAAAGESALLAEAIPMGEGEAAAPPPPMPLEQARALSRAQRQATRRRVDKPALTGDDASPPDEERHIDAGGSNLAGFFSFMKSILFGARQEQTPDKDLGAMLQQALARQQGGDKAGGMESKSLFAAMDAPLRGLTPDDVRYASDVDAAYSRRPRIGARFLSIVLVGFFFLLVVWAGFAEIDEVAHSEGSVVGSQRTQSISNLEGGIMRAVLVREGQTVQKDDVVAQIDNEVAASAYRDAVNRSMDDAMAIIRLEAELRSEEPVFPTDLLEWGSELIGKPIDPATLAQAQQIVRDQEVAWRSRQSRFEADDNVLRSQASQRGQDVLEQEAHRTQARSSLALAIQQRDAAATLLSRRNFSRLEYLGMEQRVVELKGQVEMLDASIPRARAAAAEAEHRIESHRAEYEAAITEEINKRRVELVSLRETISAGSDRVTRTDVRSPVRGIVKQIHINTIGGVIRSGEPIMDIVPLDDTLLVEARVRPQDVAFLRPGQDVMVKVTAYDFSIYGGLEGRLEQISADTIEDKRGEFFYIVKVRTRKTFLTYHNEVLPIIPGMLVQADILIGKKTILQYVMKPILKTKQNALTER